MQLRFLTAAIIYTGSYLPLSLILLFQDFKYESLGRPFCTNWDSFGAYCDLPLRNPKVAISLVILCVICFLITIFTLFVVSPKRQIRIFESKYIPSDLMSYTLPYVVSFMSLDYQQQSKFFGFIIFMIWLFLITYKSGQIILNPLLVVFGWKLYEIRYAFSGSANLINGIALSKCEISPNQEYRHSQIQDVLIIKE
jgi:hypothetical protein